MRRKEDGETARKKQNPKEDALDLPLQAEISVLLQYVKMMPMSMRAQFLPGLAYLADHVQIPEHLRSVILAQFSACNIEPFESTKNKFIIDLFCKFLKLNKLKNMLSDPQKIKPFRQRTMENQEEGSKILTAFQPNFSSKKQSFDPIEFTINPQYEFYSKMWKIYTDTHLNLDYRFRELNPSYSFYAPPRFFVKVEEMRQFQTNFTQKGNILMLSFEGSKIVGKKSFAFTQGSTVYWCIKKQKNFEDVLNEIVEEKEKQIKEKQAGKKKENTNNEESKAVDNNNVNNAEEGLRMNNNFKTAYKMIGHHGKVTSISLSNDQLYLLSAGTDRTVKLWCLRQKALLAEYKGHLATIWTVNFNRCGYFFLTASADKTAKLWVTDDPTPQRVYSGHTEDVIKADFMSNPDLMITCSDDRTVRIWNVLTTQLMQILKTENVTINVTMSLSGRYLMACDSKGKMTLYDLLQGEALNEFVVPEKDSETDKSFAPKNLRIHDMCFSLDEKQFSCVSSRYILIYSFDKISEKPSKNLLMDSQASQQSIATKQVIYTGRESNLVYCRYHEKGVLVVGASIRKKQ